MVSLGTIVNDTLGFFGARGAGIGYVIDSMPLIGSSRGQLENMMDMYVETAMGHGTGPIQRMMTSGAMGMGMMPWGMPFAMPGPMGMMPHMAPLCGCGYAGGMQQMDLGAGSTDIPFLSRLFSPNRRMAGDFERLLRTNPQARAAFEAQIGGRIVDFGIRNNGKFTVMRYGGGFNAGPMMMGNPMASMGLGAFSMMNHSVMGHFGGMGMMNPMSMFGGNPFMGMAMGGFMNVAGMQGPAGPGAGFVDNSGGRGGWGFGSWNPLAMPGNINNTNPHYENAHQAQTASLLADPSLTVEDKVTLLIMLIMKKMDKDIERQAQYINSIQQQQSSRGGKGGKFGMGASGPFGGANDGNNSPSIDVETMKLKRMIDKRSQMFDMLRQIIDKYNETAKGIIQSIGR